MEGGSLVDNKGDNVKEDDVVNKEGTKCLIMLVHQRDILDLGTKG